MTYLSVVPIVHHSIVHKKGHRVPVSDGYDGTLLINLNTYRGKMQMPTVPPVGFLNITWTC